jgi:predicted  nucleic acid-binding Zn-ribbon protein
MNKQCEQCGFEFDDGGFEWKKVCKKCFAISKGGNKPVQKPIQKQSEVSGFRPATEAPKSQEDGKWMNPIYADCFNFVLTLIESQGDNGKVFDGNSFASMVNTLFTRRLGR